jgi:methylmalonyl-CoA/ethylmalonyl-CoA epimerase
MPPVQPERLDHLVLAVRELEPAMAAWARAFDIQAEGPVEPGGTHMRLAFLRMAEQVNGKEGAFLELVTPTTPVHRVSQHIEEQGEGMFSLSVQVEDLNAAVAELRANSLEVSDPEDGVLPNTRIARIPRASAHGVAVQLIERR